MNQLTLILTLLFLIGCTNEKPSGFPWQAINGRDNGVHFDRTPLYQARIPPHWKRKDPSPNESIADTMKPLCEFWISEEGPLRITVHNFPVKGMRIPPSAQLQRWKNQFEELDLTKTSTSSCSHGGFTGLCLDAQGKMHGQQVRVLAWSMQLAPEHDRQFVTDTQVRADYTIKAVGPVHLMDQYQKEILAFANSFELIQELPEQ